MDNVVNLKLKEYKTIDAVCDDGRLLTVVPWDYSQLGSVVSICWTGHFSLLSVSGSGSLHFILRGISDTRTDVALHWGINIFKFASARWGLVSVSCIGAVGSLGAARLEICSRCASRSSGRARISVELSLASASKRSPNVSEGLGLNSPSSLECETCFFYS